MSKSLRFSEKWFRRGLWGIALLFANFLIGLGGLVVGDLPRVEPSNQVEDFVDAPRDTALRTELQRIDRRLQALQDSRERAQLVHTAARNQAQNARATFSNWLATRTATAQPEQDAELLRRTTGLDALKAAERRAQAALEQLDQSTLALQQTRAGAQAALDTVHTDAETAWRAVQQTVELRIFLIRLALTLPLLGIAVWLFVKQRHSRYWPFVWGFVFFALFAFFVELVPYLPSYGGYVRYLVGIVLTLIGGRYAIGALQRYRERQKAAESRSETERRAGIHYELAHERLAKSICPGCERPVDLKDGTRNYCMHCGISLFQPCPACGARVSAFARYCHACGAPGAVTPAATP